MQAGYFAFTPYEMRLPTVTRCAITRREVSWGGCGQRSTDARRRPRRVLMGSTRIDRLAMRGQHAIPLDDERAARLGRLGALERHVSQSCWGTQVRMSNLCSGEHEARLVSITALATWAIHHDTTILRGPLASGALERYPFSQQGCA